MKKLKRLYYKDRIKKYLFNDNFIEVPVFYNNDGKSIRFLLESKLESRKYELITGIIYDVFYKYGSMISVGFGDKGPNHGLFRGISPKLMKKYYKKYSLKRLVKAYYVSRLDPTYVTIDRPYYIAYYSKTSDFNIDKYLKDLYENNLDVNIVFLEVRHGVAIHFYDDRGFDLVCEDKEFAKYLYDKYKDDIMECNIDFSTMNNF